MDGDVVKHLNRRHEESAKMLEIWQKAKDCRKGQTAIHKAGVTYLPKLSGQTADEYAAYKRRAVFYGAMSRTVDAFGGMIMRTPPTIDNPNTILDDVTNTGVSLYDFTAELLDEILTVGFAAVLVEHTPDVQAVTVGQAQALGARPYLAAFAAKCVINWRMSKGRFLQVVLEEEEYEQVSEFEQKERDLYRVLDIDQQGFYRQRKFVQSEKNKEEFIQIGDDIYPTMNGAKLREIPFYFVGDVDELPPLIDIVYLNISHYMTTADLENGRHFTGLPTPVVSGVQLNEGQTLNIGSSAAWVFPQPDAKASYLEFTGQGLGSLEKGIETKEKQMAALGARMLSDSVVAETATAASLKSSGEFSVLAMTARKLGNVLTKACSFMYQWAGLGEVTIKLNTDFLPTKMTPEELNSLVLAWQSGAISYQTLHANMQQGEIVSPASTPEDEQAAIGESAPVMVGGDDPTL